MSKPLFSILFALIILLLVSSCYQNKVFDDYKEIDSGVWHEDSLVRFQMDIPKNASGQFDFFYNIRYELSYPYYNLYVSYYLEDSLGNPISSELQEIILFDRKSGEPLGDGLGGQFDIVVPAMNFFELPYSGKYHYKIKQFMRTKNLTGITSFGLEVNRLVE